jgi:uncharacterized protein YutE (UPF0331/DUF86 family)
LNASKRNYSISRKTKPNCSKKSGHLLRQKRLQNAPIYLCAEIVLDIADLIAIKKGYPKASTYSDSIFKLGDYAAIPANFAKKFVYIAGLRNFLAHDYQKSTVPEIEKFLQSGIKDINQFITHIEKL